MLVACGGAGDQQGRCEEMVPAAIIAGTLGLTFELGELEQGLKVGRR
jgi:hypothetical protein